MDKQSEAGAVSPPFQDVIREVLVCIANPVSPIQFVSTASSLCRIHRVRRTARTGLDPFFHAWFGVTKLLQ